MYILKLSRRQNSIKYSQTDNRDSVWKGSDASGTKSACIFRMLFLYLVDPWHCFFLDVGPRSVGTFFKSWGDFVPEKTLLDTECALEKESYITHLKIILSSLVCIYFNQSPTTVIFVSAISSFLLWRVTLPALWFHYFPSSRLFWTNLCRGLAPTVHTTPSVIPSLICCNP
jgi:hypothetical protein